MDINWFFVRLYNTEIDHVSQLLRFSVNYFYLNLISIQFLRGNSQDSLFNFANLSMDLINCGGRDSQGSLKVAFRDRDFDFSHRCLNLLSECSSWFNLEYYIQNT